jgi:hypothetical protein
MLASLPHLALPVNTLIDRKRSFLWGGQTNPKV